MDVDERTTGGAHHDELIALTPLIRRVIASRTNDAHIVDDLVQETLVRLMHAQGRLDQAALAPYAVVVARNLLHAHWREGANARHQAHRLIDLRDAPRPESQVLRREEGHAVTTALARLPQRERQNLLAHEIDGQTTSELAAQSGLTAGAIAAQLHRTRAKLRVEYLLTLAQGALPSQQCRPVLLALSGGDRRRQRELDAAGHLLECGSCAEISGPLLDRMPSGLEGDEALIAINSDRDVVLARQRGREIAAQIDFTRTELTLIATAISEVVRNVVRFADQGQMRVGIVAEGLRRGVVIVIRDVGPGIADVGRALEDGFSTYGGMGLGLPGSRRLMDEFHIASEIGKGTTVTMTKWCRNG